LTNWKTCFSIGDNCGNLALRDAIELVKIEAVYTAVPEEIKRFC
jgi:hypothetical protein